jgi:tetratricopeptide (TPR) repeat protein
VTRWKAARLEEIELRRGGWTPIRAHFDVQALGVNAWSGENAGDTLIGEHTEEDTGHEELYLVLRGRASFTVAGDELDAPQGTIVYVRDPKASRQAVAHEPRTTVLSAGGKPGEPFTVSEWERASPYNDRGMEHYHAGRYDEAAAAFEEGIQALPEFGGVHYNAGCMRALTGETEQALAHLRRAIELDPRFAELARGDSDFDGIREQVSALTG